MDNVEYAYPERVTVTGTEPMEHHERFVVCLNALVDDFKAQLGTEAAVELAGFTGMAYIDRANAGKDTGDAYENIYDMACTVDAAYKRCGLQSPGSDMVDDAVKRMGEHLTQNQVDITKVAEYLSQFSRSDSRGMALYDPDAQARDTVSRGKNGAGEVTRVGDFHPENDGLAVESTDEADDDDLEGYYNPELTGEMVTLLRLTAMGLRINKPEEGGARGGGGFSLTGLITRPFRTHVANNRAMHLDRAAEGLQAFDQLVSNGRGADESKKAYAARVKSAAGEFLGHMSKGLSDPGMKIAMANGVDKKHLISLQNGLDAWKSLNVDLLGKMKMDKIADNIGKLFTRLFSRLSGTAPSPSS